jgi:hypothetical protein
VTIAVGTASLAAGATKTLTLSLNRSGASLLRHLHVISAQVRVTAGAKVLRSAAVTIRKPKKKKR